MNTTANHDVLKLVTLNQIANLTFGKADPDGELLRRFQPFIWVRRLGSDHRNLA